MGNINSNIFSIYPASNRSATGDFKARLNIEENIIKANNTITDYNSYRVNGLDLKSVNSELHIKPGRCVINGYVIDIKDSIAISQTIVADTIYYVYLSLSPRAKIVHMGNYEDSITELNLTDSGPNSWVDTFTGDGTTTSFELTYTPQSMTEVSIDGVSTAAYQISDNIVTFTSAPAVNSIIRISYTFPDSLIGFNYIIRTQPLSSVSAWQLFLGTYDSSTQKYDDKLSKAKIDGNKVKISIPSESGLINNNAYYSTYLENFLNDFVIDDGDIN